MNIMTEILAVDLIASAKQFQVIFFLIKATAKRKKAPTAPASVGVKKPKYIPPITRKNTKISSQTFFRDIILSMRETLSGLKGADSGLARTHATIIRA